MIVDDPVPTQSNTVKETATAVTNTPDTLLQCLLWLTRYWHNPCTAQMLTAGLPIENHRLTPPLFKRAAERANLTAVFETCRLTKLRHDMLPAVLITKQGQGILITKILGTHQVEAWFPDEQEQTREVTIETLQDTYSGQMIFVTSTYQFSARSEENLGKTTDKHWFWHTIKNIWPLYSEILLASFLINLFALAVPLFVMNVYDRVVPNQATETLWVLASGVLFILLFDFLLRLLRSYFIDTAGKNIDIQLSGRIFEQILSIKMGVRPQSVGAFANTIQSFESFREFITSSTVTILVDLPFVFLYILVVAFIGGTLALIPLIMVPLIVGIGWLAQRSMQNLTQQSYRYANEKQATLIESLSNAETIKSLGAEGLMQRRWEQTIRLAGRLSVHLHGITNINVFFSVFAQQFGYVLIIIWGVYKINSGDLTTGGLIACSILTSRALAPMSQVAALLTRYYQSYQSLVSLENVMKMPVDRPIGKTYLHRNAWRGTIDFQNVDFNYPQAKIPSLRQVSFAIKAGEKVAIIGKIGSGKTTIAKLLLGLHNPDAGTILIDGVEQHQIDIADLRHHIGYVPQDVTLFYGSIKENITFGAPPVEDDKIWQVAQLAGIDQFTQNHPEGLNRQIGERGVGLSGGQRQSIVVARALLQDSPIIIMDEPTHAMDDHTENLLKNRLATYLTNKTFILITHKGSLLSLVDRLIVMDNGRILANGPKAQVLQALSEGKIHVSEKS